MSLCDGNTMIKCPLPCIYKTMLTIRTMLPWHQQHHNPSKEAIETLVVMVPAKGTYFSEDQWASYPFQWAQAIM